MSFSETVELRGHIIDSYALPQLMDDVMDRGGDYVIQQIEVGRRKDEPSYARIQISAPTRELLALLVDHAQRIGASPEHPEQVELQPAPAAGVFPEEFYSTTNLDTEVRLRGEWVRVEWPEMDCAIAVDPEQRRAWTIALSDIKAGEQIVVGHEGVRVIPLQREAQVGAHPRDRRALTGDSCSPGSGYPGRRASPDPHWHARAGRGADP